MLKRVFHKIKQIINEYLLMIKACSLIKPFLSRGFYRIRHRKLIKSFGFPPLMWVHKSDSHPVVEDSEIRLYYGGWSGKIVVFSSVGVFSFYSKKEIVSISNIIQYFDLINYPKNENLAVLKEKLLIISSFVDGKSYFDDNHILMLAKDIILLNSAASKTIRPRKYDFLSTFDLENVPFYVQHGDFAAKNVLWSQDNKYRLIDFDTIDVFPCFYDLFRLLIIDNKKRGLDIFIGGSLDEYISNFMFDNKIDLNLDIFKDKCLAVFTIVTYRYWFTNNIIEKFLPDSYSMSHKIINLLQKTN